MIFPYKPFFWKIKGRCTLGAPQNYLLTQLQIPMQTGSTSTGLPTPQCDGRFNETKYTLHNINNSQKYGKKLMTVSLQPLPTFFLKKSRAVILKLHCASMKLPLICIYKLTWHSLSMKHFISVPLPVREKHKTTLWHKHRYASKQEAHQHISSNHNVRGGLTQLDILIITAIVYNKWRKLMTVFWQIKYWTILHLFWKPREHINSEYPAISWKITLDVVVWEK